MGFVTTIETTQIRIHDPHGSSANDVAYITLWIAHNLYEKAVPFDDTLGHICLMCSETLDRIQSSILHHI